MRFLVLVVVANVAYVLVASVLRVRDRRFAKLRRLEEAAHDWQATGYLVPMRFYWHGSNPVLLWRRLSDGRNFPLEIE
jgi:hypothetical protein